jgi:hypothetical protein
LAFAEDLLADALIAMTFCLKMSEVEVVVVDEYQIEEDVSSKNQLMYL